MQAGGYLTCLAKLWLQLAFSLLYFCHRISPTPITPTHTASAPANKQQAKQCNLYILTCPWSDAGETSSMMVADSALPSPPKRNQQIKQPKCRKQIQVIICKRTNVNNKAYAKQSDNVLPLL